MLAVIRQVFAVLL